jgi:hypothetical protein
MGKLGRPFVEEVLPGVPDFVPPPGSLSADKPIGRKENFQSFCLPFQEKVNILLE